MALDSLDVGGTETHVLSLAEELIQRGVYLVIAGREGKLLSEFKKIGCPIYLVNFPLTLNIEEEQKKDLYEKIRTIMEKEKITIVHAHQTPSGFITFSAAKDLGIPAIFTVHGTYYPKSEIIQVLKLSSLIICVSPPTQKYIEELNDQSSIIIPNGINTSQYTLIDDSEVLDLKKQLGIPPDAATILYSSRLNWAKANICMMLLRACKDIKLSFAPNLHVIIVGDGPRFHDIQNLANLINRTCKDEFIHLIGEKYHDMQKYYSMADCVVGTGRVALEAMACSKPVIAVGNHGYFGLVRKEEYEEAWYCYFGDHASKKSCSRFTLVHDLKPIVSSKSYAEKIGSDARKWVVDQFDIHQSAEKLLNLYISMLGDTAT